LVGLGAELVASGGTASALRAWGLPVTEVEAVTGYAEMLGGRVKTLHPAIHGGILARDSEVDRAELAGRGIGLVDVVVCNLYPFAQTVARAGVGDGEAMEQVDIGGVTLLRAAAKNFQRVVVVCDPQDYAGVLEGLGLGGLSLEARRGLARKAFAHTAAYDAAIASWMEGEGLPRSLRVSAERAQTLRYGENPHQAAALYQTGPQVYQALQGKELSYNNLLDLDAAWSAVELARGMGPCVAIVKHGNPCGLAVAQGGWVEAFGKALASDPVSAFGGVIALDGEVGLEFAEALGKLFVEVLAAPSFSDEALGWLAARKPDCRAVKVSPHEPQRLLLRSVRGGFLAQTPDRAEDDPQGWEVVTRRAPSEAEWADLRLAWAASRAVKSNAIVFAKGGATVGVGAGQMSRVDAVRLAAWRAGERAQGSVMGSDAFFPFPDGVELAASAGVTACAQPGGSKKDAEVIEAADRAGMAMVLTGKRHFLH
jgi:phosphoribosylaminoimidazolecarboxamide formyltransferase/IMP cyclohydrolase